MLVDELIGDVSDSYYSSGQEISIFSFQHRLKRTSSQTDQSGGSTGDLFKRVKLLCTNQNHGYNL